MALVGQCGEPLPHTTLQVLWSSLGGCHQGPEELGQVVIGRDLRNFEFCLWARSQEPGAGLALWSQPCQNGAVWEQPLLGLRVLGCGW